MTNNPIPRMSKTLQSQLMKYRDRLANSPYTPKKSSLVDCITYLLEEGTANGQAKNSGKD